MRSAYINLRNNAKRRGKLFDLTYAEFSEFCHETRYLAGKGKQADSYTIDRRDNALGYTKRNIRVMTLADNARKSTKVLVYDWYSKTAMYVEMTNQELQSGSDNPF